MSSTLKTLSCGRWTSVARCTCCGSLRLALGSSVMAVDEEQLLDLLAVLVEASATMAPVAQGSASTVAS